ncbi:MAG: type II toxin-antitoxin system PrlF family antitoxin [Burkholderiaceae bacterium]
MPIIRELATITSKGQITLPKPIRQALGVDAGGKVAFNLNERGQITVSRAESEHEDPAIGAFLELLAADVQAGRNLSSLPEELAQSMLERVNGADVRLDEEIEGDVAL